MAGARKAVHPGKVAYTFALGSANLYAAIEGNEDLLCLPVDRTNLPHTIMQNDRVFSINNTTQIDLQGQAASESDGHRLISGTGGQLQFVRGAYASSGGKSFICLASTHEKGGVRSSRIVLNLTPGNIATTPRTDVYVRRHRVRNGEPQREVRGRARTGTHLHRAPRFPCGLERLAHDHRLIPHGLFPS